MKNKVLRRLAIGLSLCLSGLLGVAAARFTFASFVTALDTLLPQEVCPAESPSLESAGIIPAPEVQHRRSLLPPFRGFEPGDLQGPWLVDVAYRQEIEGSLEQYPDVEQAIQDSGFAPLAFVWAIIQVESSGSPEAVNSTSQATGLMQVIPSTSKVPMQDLLTPGVGIAEGVRDLNDKLAKNDGDLYEAMFDYSGGARHVFWGRMVGWASKESFDQAYWQRLLSAYEDLTGTRATAEPVEEIAQIRTPPAEQAPAPEWTEELTRLRAILTAEPPSPSKSFPILR